MDGFLSKLVSDALLSVTLALLLEVRAGMGPSLNIKTDIDVVRKCMSDTENLNQVSVEMVVPQNLRSIFIFSLLLYLISLLIFLFEVVFKKIKKLFSGKGISALK